MSRTRTAALKEARELALEIITNKDYKVMLIARANAGTLMPAVETLLYHYAFGKPADIIESHTVVEDMRGKKVEELLDDLETTKRELMQALDARAHAEQLLKEIAAQREQDAQRQMDASNVVHFADHVPSKPERTH